MNNYIRFGWFIRLKTSYGQKVIHQKDDLYPTLLPIIPGFIYLCTGENWSPMALDT